MSSWCRGRRRPLPRVNADGRWFGMGRQEADAVSGWLFPVSQMTEQCGGQVSARERDGSLDRCCGDACECGTEGVSTTITSTAISGTVVPDATYEDTYTRDDDAGDIGALELPAGTAWVTSAGDVWGILAEAAYLVTASDAALSTCRVTTNLADGDLSVVTQSCSALVTAQGGVSFRFSDDANGWLLIYDADNGQCYKLIKRVAGVHTTMQRLPVTSGTEDTLRVRFLGSAIECFINGTSYGTVTDSFNSTALQHGLAEVPDAVYVCYDNFRIRPTS